MDEENLTDEQQAERIRQWLRENGPAVFGGIGIGLVALFGWNQWQSYGIQRAEEASIIYEELVVKTQANKQDEANVLLAELASDYSGSPYIDQAHLRLAKLSLDRNDFESAASHLESIIAKSSIEAMLQIARIRLARIRLQQEQYDVALLALDGMKTDSAFFAQANDVRGDVYVAMNRAEDALAAYDAALTDMRQPPAIDRAYVQAKRDSLDVDEPVILTGAPVELSNEGEAGDASAATE